MLFVCGVPGTGKTDFADELCKELSLENYSVKSLAQNKTGRFFGDDKMAKLLIEAINEIKDLNYVLVGNLCFVNAGNKFERIPSAVFSAIQIESLYIVVDRPQKICKRLLNKDKKKQNENFMKELQEEETRYAAELAHKLGIPLNIVYENKKINSFSVIGEENIILPIKPVYADKILNGEKKYEFRKRLCRKDVGKIYIYATAPVKRIVGEAEIVQKLEMEKNALWEKTKNDSGISREFYDSYFMHQDYACAYQVGSTKRYCKPLTLESLGIKYVPQSFAYYGELKI